MYYLIKRFLLKNYLNSDIIPPCPILGTIPEGLEGLDQMEKFKNFGKTLSALRKEKNIQQKELAALMKDRGISITNQAISKWETDKAVPNAIQFLNLCDILEVEDVMSSFSEGHTGLQSGLNAEGRKMVTELIHFLSENPKFSIQTSTVAE